MCRIDQKAWVRRDSDGGYPPGGADEEEPVMRELTCDACGSEFSTDERGAVLVLQDAQPVPRGKDVIR